MRVVAAGYLADGSAEAERDQAIEDRNRWHGLAAAWEANAHAAQERVDEAVQFLYDHLNKPPGPGDGDELHADMAFVDNLRAALTGLPTTKDTNA